MRLPMIRLQPVDTPEILETMVNFPRPSIYIQADVVQARERAFVQLLGDAYLYYSLQCNHLGRPSGQAWSLFRHYSRKNLPLGSRFDPLIEIVRRH